MTCREAEGLIMPYIGGRLADEELDGFLRHIGECPACLEELEIYFTVDVGIRQLDSDAGNYNIKGAMEAMLEQSRQHLQNMTKLRIVRYAASTLGVLGLIVTILLQCRIWWQQAIF